MTRIAIIGAGLSGLSLASRLQTQAEVLIFEKSRGPGGRMATRYADPYRFDHGTQFFTAKSDEFQRAVAALEQTGAVAAWNARFAECQRGTITAQRQWDHDYPHYVGTPGMNAVGKQLAQGLDICYDKVTSITRSGDCWEVNTDSSTAQFDWVVVTTPPAQALQLMPPDFRSRAQLETKQMRACYALMLGFTQPLAMPWDAALVRDADISWVSVNSSKPGRADAFTLVAHATNAWADAHLDDDPDTVIEHLLGELTEVVGRDLRQADHVGLQRWKYANIDRQGGADFFLDTPNRLCACGDWCIRGRVEAAFLSASRAADAIARLL